MRAVIIGNGTICDHSYIRSLIHTDDIIICADGGLKHAAKMGITPDIAIGDFDSSEKDGSVMTYVYPKRKDFTDGELAVDHAIEQGYDEILLLGMTGTRIDHTLTNIFLLTKPANIYMADDHNEIYLVRSELIIKGKKGKTLSIIPVSGDLKGIQTEGLEYPLHGETLFFGHSRGNSNVITSDLCRISVQSGMGIVLINNGE